MKSFLLFTVACCVYCPLVQAEQTYLSVTSAPDNPYTSVTTSASGEYLAATAYNVGIYTSSNYGYDWNFVYSSALPWLSIASSSSGSLLAASTQSDGIWISANSGQSWTQTTAATNSYYYSIASSASGSYLFTGDYDYGTIIYSNNAGATWNTVERYGQWTGFACSYSGQYVVVASVDQGGWESNDFGVTYNQTLAVPNLSAVAISANGSIMYIAEKDGNIYVSTAYGLGWEYTGAPYGYEWTTVACSGTGQYVAAGIFEGAIYVSSDYGTTFDLVASDISAWKFITMSESGTYITAVTDYQTVGGTGNIFYNYMAPTSRPSSLPSTQPSHQPSAAPSAQPTSVPSLRPNSASPTSWPSSNPSGDPTGRPTQNPIYSPDTADITSVVMSSSNTSTYSFSNLGCNSVAYLSVSILVCFLDDTSNGFLSITAGSGSNSVVVSSSCAPTTTCGSAVCAINVDVTSAMNCEVGGSVDITTQTVNADEQSGLQSICTYRGNQNLQFVMSYTLSAFPLPTSRPTHSPTEQSEAGFIFNASPNTPFYIIVAVTLLFTALGFFLIRVRDSFDSGYASISVMATCFDLAILKGYHVTSEIIYIAVLLGQGLKIPAIIIILGRVLNLLPAMYYLMITFGPTRYSSWYGKRIDKEHLFRNSTLYAIVTILLLIEQSMVRYLPWKPNGFSRLSAGFPDVFMFVLSSRFRLAQLCLVLIVQLVVLVNSYNDVSSKIELAVVLLYLVSSVIAFVMAALTNFLRIGSINGGDSSKSGDDLVKTENPLQEASTGEERDTEMRRTFTGEALRIQHLEERESLLEGELASMKSELRDIKLLLATIQVGRDNAV